MARGAIMSSIDFQPMCQFRLAKVSSSYKDQPVMKDSYGAEYALQQLWIDSKGRKKWENVEVVDLSSEVQS